MRELELKQERDTLEAERDALEAESSALKERERALGQRLSENLRKSARKRDRH